MRRAKIVCTLGPATSNERRIRELVYAGMDVARLNMSHGTHEDHAEAYRLVREAVRRQRPRRRHPGRPAGAQDPARDLLRRPGAADAAARPGRSPPATSTATPRSAARRTRGSPATSSAGDPILIDDGKVRLRVTEVKDGTDVVCEVLVGGKVSNHKGINLPGVAVSVPALSEKDIEDLRFALHLTVDFIALSFVRERRRRRGRAPDHARGGRACSRSSPRSRSRRRSRTSTR